MASQTESQTTGAEATNGATPDPHARTRSYGAVMGVYAAMTGVFLAWRQRSGGGLPERYEALDLATVGVATHKTSRMLAKEKVTAPLRAPFTEFEKSEGFNEVSEKPVGSGVRKTVGELLGCPYCLDMWVATGYAAGLVAAPRVTRFAAGVMSAVAIADFLQVAYKAGQERA